MEGVEERDRLEGGCWAHDMLGRHTMRQCRPKAGVCGEGAPMSACLGTNAVWRAMHETEMCKCLPTLFSQNVQVCVQKYSACHAMQKCVCVQMPRHNVKGKGTNKCPKMPSSVKMPHVNKLQKENTTAMPKLSECPATKQNCCHVDYGRG